MPLIHFNLADGALVTATAEVGESVMRVARRYSIEAILAECGGACSCATCHLHVAAEWFERLPPRAALEEDMLEFAEGVDRYSRLGCQIVMSAALDGLVVHVPESQY